MDNDDGPVGRILSRREVLALVGALGATTLLGPTYGQESTGATAPLPACVVRPEQAEGPFFADADLERSDLRSEPTTGEVRGGAPLRLTIRVFRIGEACTPLPNAIVNLWSCDAHGEYSAFDDRAQGVSNVGESWLRGFQRTDGAGEARFTTIYPGWYPGRTAHIHLKVRTDPATGERFEFTSQLYFDDALSDVVLQGEPYPEGAARRTRNADDFLFRRGGEQLLLDVRAEGDGYAATFDLGLDLR